MGAGRDAERGFTLIELMVVVLVVGILLAIAIPTFLGARLRAHDAVARQSLQISLSAAASEVDAPINAEGMARLETSITYVGAGSTSTGPTTVSIAVTDAAWAATALSESGTCFSVRSDFASRPTWARTTGEGCSGRDILPGGGDEGDGRAGELGSIDDGPAGEIPANGTTPYADVVMKSEGLAAYWRLDESAPGEVRDAGPRSLTGKYAGGTGFGEKPAVASSPSSVRFGPDGFAALPTIDVDWSAGLSIVAWVRPDGPGFYDRIVELSNGRSTDGIYLGRPTNQARLYFEVRPKGATPKRIVGPSGSLVDGSWQLVAATLTPSGRVTLYRNGVKVLIAEGSPLPAPGARTENYLGRSAWSTEPPFAGLVDEVAMWSRPLSATEIAQLYAARNAT